MKMYRIVLSFAVLVSLVTMSQNAAGRLSREKVSTDNWSHATPKQHSEANSLFEEGKKKFELNRLFEATGLFEEALIVYEREQNTEGVIKVLANLGRTYELQGRYAQALEANEEALSLLQSIQEDALTEGDILTNISSVYIAQGKYQEAQDILGTALNMLGSFENTEEKSRAFLTAGTLNLKLNSLEKSLELIRESLSISEQNGYIYLSDRAIALQTQVLLILGKEGEAIELADALLRLRENDGEGSIFSLLMASDVYRLSDDSQRSLELMEGALLISQEYSNLEYEATVSLVIGQIYQFTGRVEDSIELYERSLTISKDVDHRFIEANCLISLGILNLNSGHFSQAVELFEEVIIIATENQSFELKANVSVPLGAAYTNLGEFEHATEIYLEAIDISRRLGFVQIEANLLNNLGGLYLFTGRSQQEALEIFESALSLIDENPSLLGDLSRDIILSSIVSIQVLLGELGEALDVSERILADVGSGSSKPLLEEISLLNIGAIRFIFGQPELAIGYLERAASKASENRLIAIQMQAKSLLILAYLQVGDFEKADVLSEEIKAVMYTFQSELPLLANVDVESLFELSTEEILLQQSLILLENSRALGNILSEYIALSQIANLLLFSDDSVGAYKAFEEILILSRDSGNVLAEIQALTQLGLIARLEDNTETAIVFYKQAVNRIQEVRENLRNLPLAEQQAYTDSVSDIYRELADLLLVQGRILEAQQVLELLKLQEIREYTGNERLAETTGELILLSEEEKIIDEYRTLIEFGQKLKACEDAPECDELELLRNQLDAQRRQYNDAITSLQNFFKERLLHGGNPELILNPPRFELEAKEVIDQQPGTVVVYPLVLDDKLWLLWAAEGRVISRREILVDRVEIGNEIVEFRSLLEDQYSDLAQLKATAQKLYRWLIEPIEMELEANQEIKHLVFSLDRTTRYLPMAALFDGEQYLVEKYAVSTILSAGLTDHNSRSPVGTEGVSILGAGVSLGSDEFPSLTYVPAELDEIVQDEENLEDKGLYRGRQLLDPDFTISALRDALSGRQLLHIATHGKFVPGRRDESYLLIGNERRLPIADIETLSTYLEDVHLVVLSACQTALGGPNEEGLEIAGLGYYFLKSQVDAVMASLWNVNDASTSRLMQMFYQNLAAGTEDNPITKAEALRAAQLSMLDDDNSVDSDDARLAVTPQDGVTNSDQAVSTYSHPYYWAPFILIGNGL